MAEWVELKDMTPCCHLSVAKISADLRPPRYLRNSYTTFSRFVASIKLFYAGPRLV